MKMTQQHFDYVKNALAAVWTQEKHSAHRRFIENEGKAKDISQRLRWDWVYYADLSPWICDTLYAYLDDTHIDTALKRAIKELRISC